MSLWSRFIAWLEFKPAKSVGEKVVEPLSPLEADYSYDWGKTVDVQKGDFDCILNGPYFKLGYPDKVPTKPRRKPKVAKAPKKAPTPPKKAKKPAKARSVRKRKGSR